MKITKEHIAEIAEELEVGMIVYINRDTLEIRSILDWENAILDDPIWEEEYNRIEQEWNDYVTINKMESREAFQIMENFTNEVDDQNFRVELIHILERKSPFANFKMAVESSNLREAWFSFRKNEYVNYVRTILELENFEFN